MTPSIRRLMPLVAVLLALGAFALYRWSTKPAQPPESPESAAIAGGGQPTLVEFGMDTCASCRAMHRVLDELRAADAARLRVIAVNVMQEPEATAHWRIRAIPTQVLLDGQGQEIDRHLGYLSAEAIRERFAALGLPLDKAPGTP